MLSITRRHALALGGTSLLLPSTLHAQAAWPAGPVTFVVGYAAGGSTDKVSKALVSRVVSKEALVTERQVVEAIEFHLR